MKTVITNIGLKRIIEVGNNGPKLTIKTVKIGSDIINPDSSITDVSGFVWEGNSSFIKYLVQDDNSFIFQISLDETIGDFAIGNIGLYLEDGTLFALTSFISKDQKIKTGSVPGNKKVYEIPIQLSGISTVLDVKYLLTADASIPVLANEILLPAVDKTTFSTYAILSFTNKNVPGFAIRTASGWSYVYGSVPGSTGNGSTYYKMFTKDAFKNQILSIPVTEHQLGTSPFLAYFQKAQSNKYINQNVDFSIDLDGNIEITVKELFDGRLLLCTPFTQSDLVITSQVNQILYGDVKEVTK